MENGSQLIVIGSSAGGIEALSRLVAGLPADLPAAVVIAQHLDPRRSSHLAEILERHATLPIKVVDATTRLDDGVIFVVPPNRLVEVADGGENAVECAGGHGNLVDRRAGTSVSYHHPGGGGNR